MGLEMTGSVVGMDALASPYKLWLAKEALFDIK
jgi:hypothetical protein